MRVYLLGVNLDIEKGEILNSPRLAEAADTVKLLTNPNNKIVIISHRGRPKGSENSLSLKAVKTVLENKIGKPIIFFPKFNFPAIREKIDGGKGGSVFMLENLRFLPSENYDNSDLAKHLASLGNVYIEDDFATSHRVNSSNAGIAEILPSRFGPIFKKEISNLTKASKHPKKPFVLIIGGVKVADKIGVIENLLHKVDKILLGGGAANTFLKAENVDIGKSVYDERVVPVAKKFLGNKKIVLPVDFKKEKDGIMDIGPKTIKNYAEIIKNAKTIVWSGPLGYIENKKFAKGTAQIAREILKNKTAKVIIGGGETTVAVSSVIKRSEKNIFISTGGGAMLAFLAGKKLPVVEIIKNKKQKKM